MFKRCSDSKDSGLVMLKIRGKPCKLKTDSKHLVKIEPLRDGLIYGDLTSFIKNSDKACQFYDESKKVFVERISHYLSICEEREFNDKIVKMNGEKKEVKVSVTFAYAHEYDDNHQDRKRHLHCEYKLEIV